MEYLFVFDCIAFGVSSKDIFEGRVCSVFVPFEFGRFDLPPLPDQKKTKSTPPQLKFDKKLGP